MSAASPQSPDHDGRTAFTRQAQKVKDLFSIPRPLKALFDSVPILTYPQNALPQRAPRPTKRPSLYVFSTVQDGAAGKPSFNPSCLKWQTFLKIAGVEHSLVSSNNHASPTGVLPFLLPAVYGVQTSRESPLPIPSGKLIKYTEEKGSRVAEPHSIRYEAYQSLIDYRIRNAWLYTLYLDPQNATTTAHRLYVAPVSSSFLVRTTISHQLRTAAEAELLKHSELIDPESLYDEAEKAFQALSTLLGDQQWFFGEETATLFDASVFAYTHLLLDPGMGWKDARLGNSVWRHENLVLHRDRILRRYYENV